MAAVINPELYRSEDTVDIARRLVGRVLARRDPEGTVTRRVITETEAYHTADDKACHASKGRTGRTDVLFRPGGIWYVYLCYGIHEMLNLVVGPEGFPAAVLIRGVEGAVGPGRLTRALGINRSFNGKPVAPASGLWLEEGEVALPAQSIQATPRIGVDYAGKEWASKPWRFVISPSALDAALRR